MPDADIEAVREFNRFYTARLGLTRNGLYKTEHPLAEARVLYELGANDSTEVSDLRAALQIDAGQLSRLLKRLEERARGAWTSPSMPADSRCGSRRKAGRTGCWIADQRKRWRRSSTRPAAASWRR